MPVTTEDSLEKPPSRLGFAAVGVVVVLLGLFMLANNSSDETALDDQQSPTSITPTTTVATDTALTLATGPDTNDREASEHDGPERGPNGEPLPDRGAFRNALASRFTRSCDALVDGPEPVSAGLYDQHAQCVADALVNLDERCLLAAEVFYVMPGEDALNIACDINPDDQQNFRESVRQSLILACDNRLASPDSLEPYYEYERCLKRIDTELDQICYLAARAQYAQPEDARLREVCVIDPDLPLESTVS